MKRFFTHVVAVLLLQVIVATALPGQDMNLATQYFNNGEYEKAAAIYAQFVEKDERNEYFFNRYIECLLNLEQYEECERAIKKQLKKNPENVQLYVTYGGMFERKGDNEAAEEQYRKAIEKVGTDYSAITRLANTFTTNAKYELAIQTYDRGSKQFKEPHRFAYNLGDLYRRKGETAKMIEQYLHALSMEPARLASIQNMLARYLSPEEFTELQTQLYARIQEEESPDFVELLAWSFVQRRDFKSALRQYKALDKRLGENGQRLFQLANDAADAKDFDTAISAYEYIVQEKGQTNPYFFEAKREAMHTRRRKITEGYAYTVDELRLLESEYENFLSQYGKGKQTASIIRELADLEAFYINDLQKAIGLLEELRQAPGLDRNTLGRTKISLADFYLMSGEIWESTLLYSQVDKEFKEEQLGQEARFKNARLSYFNGDFQWSQAQFNILKASTSKLIANDALDLSVFIMDNLNLDTTADAISLYSGAELLVMQNRFDEAFRKLDTLRATFPEHSLQDDIIYLEAQIFDKKRDFSRAAALYQQVFEKYPQDIRADNALYALAQLYEFKTNEAEKAKALYEKVFMEYSGSVFAVDSRKRFRILRGDKIQ
jgi:tetratricopeptide (TPR) repeat protein